MNKRKLLYIMVVLVGFLQIVGYVSKQDWLRGIGILTTASPLPIVFTEVKGIETFASDFYLEYTSADSQRVSMLITPEIYGRFDAPYNYRNVVGAAVSYGPVLPDSLRTSVLNYAFVSPAVLAPSLQLSDPLIEPVIVVKTRTAGRTNVWRLEMGRSE